MTLSDLIAVMRDGKVVQFGTTREIYRKPRDLYVATFVGKPKMSLVDGALERDDGSVSVRVAGACAVDLGSAAALGLRRRELGARGPRRPRRGRAGPPRTAPRQSRAASRRPSSCSSRSARTRSWSSAPARRRSSRGSRPTRAWRSARHVQADAHARADPPLRAREGAADHQLSAGRGARGAGAVHPRLAGPEASGRTRVDRGGRPMEPNGRNRDAKIRRGPRTPPDVTAGNVRRAIWPAHDRELAIERPWHGVLSVVGHRFGVGCGQMRRDTAPYVPPVSIWRRSPKRYSARWATLSRGGAPGTRR